MGMKRQSSSRKQVLNLDNKKKEAQRPTWKSKYEQICADHITTNGNSEQIVKDKEEEEPEPKVNALDGLSGYLSSDSSSEQSDHESELQGEVKAFLKEIDALTPRNNIPKVIPQSQPKSSPALAETMPQAQEQTLPSYSVPTIAWQECYDSTTGYTYYWNVETNQVTWEMPPEYQSYMLAMKQWQQIQAHNAIMQARSQHQQQQLISQEIEAQAKETASEKQGLEKVSKAKKQDNSFGTRSDSEDEKIELITSYGPNSGDESNSDVEAETFKPPATKRKKHSKKSERTNATFGPQLPATYGCMKEKESTAEDRSNLPSNSLVPYHPEYEDSECDDSFENSKLSFIPDTGPPGIEDEQADSKLASSKSDKKTDTTPPEEVDKKLEMTDPKEVGTSSIVSSSYEQEEGEIEDESVILDRIRCQTQVLKDLGGEIPDEVKNIITDDGKKESDVENKLSLVPGYGEDSEHEDDDEKGEENQKKTSGTTVKAKLTSRAKPLTNISLPIKSKATDQTEPEDLKPTENVTVELPKEEAIESASTLTFKTELNNMENTGATKRKLKLEVPEPPMKQTQSNTDPTSNSFDQVNKDFMVWNQSSNTDETNERRGFGFGSNDWAKKPKLDRIQFVKAEVLKLPDVESTKSPDPESTSEEKPSCDIDIIDVSGLLSDKMKFLSESKESVSPVQKWAIQLETLVRAWESSELSARYIRDWLLTTTEELERLETSVAPQGWLCQWQRTEKCYSYRNLTTGEVRWEYPQGREARAEETVGGEEEMELCNTPPPSSPNPAPAAKPPPTPASPPPPPPQTQPPPQPFKEEKPDAPPLPPESPPLPPLPPPVEPPAPPPPPSESPPPLPPPHPLAEPLPPGVDPPDYPVQPPPPHPQVEYGVHLPMPVNIHMMPQMHFAAAPYSQVHMSAAPVTTNTIAAEAVTRPQQAHSVPVQDLSSELSSFYSDLASLDPSPPPQPLTPPPPPLPPSAASVPAPPPPETHPSTPPDMGVTKKKKKTKLAPGLSLKKKGVSSLVAKWQQVQQDVRRDMKTIDQEQS